MDESADFFGRHFREKNDMKLPSFGGQIVLGEDCWL
jgi:hypothetical protein